LASLDACARKRQRPRRAPARRSEAAAENERVTAVLECVRELSKEHQEIIRLRCWEGPDVREIRVRLQGRHTSTVRMRFKAAVTELREMLTEVP
jgi:DNA-directed RNA polymerase specialized sigma24 family protein